MKAGRIASIVLAIVLVAIVAFALLGRSPAPTPAGQPAPHAIDQTP